MTVASRTLGIACVLLALPVCSHAPDPAAPKSLERHVRFLAEMDPPRAATDPEALDRAAAYVAAQLRAAGGDVSDQLFEVNGVHYRNVRALFGPESEDRVVVGAHYDVAGEGPGADDNASGVAVLIALAHRLGKAELLRRVELVAYALEEPPFFGTEDMGSAHHARLLKDRGVKLRGMICLEMVGYFNDEAGSQNFPVEALRRSYPSTGNFVAVVGRGRDKDLVDEVHEAMASTGLLAVERLAAVLPLEGIDWSDHRNYWALGYSAVMITDTSFYRNPNYHQSTDTPETLDYSRMARVAEGVFESVLELAGR